MLNEKELKTSEMFKSIKNIEENYEKVYKISLRGTGPKAITEFPEIIRKCKNLQYLDLEQMPIKIIPDWIGELKNIQILKLSETNIREIPKSIENLSNLNTFNIHCLHLSKGIENIYSLNNLKHISFRAYEPLGKNIKHLNKLEYLDIDNICDDFSMENIYEINNLTELVLGGKEMTKIEKGISKLKMLKMLKITRSPVLELPEDFNLLPIKKFSYTDLWLLNIRVPEDKKFVPNWDKIFLTLSKIKTLETVELTSNNMTVLPKSIGLLKQIKKMNLDNNSLLKEESFPKEIMEMENLRELKVVPNAIKLNIIKEIKNSMGEIKIIS